MANLDNTIFDMIFENFVAYPSLDNHTDVVFMINWKMTALYIDPDTKKEYKSSSIRMTQVSTNDITNFVPFDQLTKEICTEWVSSVENIPDIKQSMLTDINNQINPPPPSIVVLPAPFPQ